MPCGVCSLLYAIGTGTCKCKAESPDKEQLPLMTGIPSVNVLSRKGLRLDGDASRDPQVRRMSVHP